MSYEKSPNLWEASLAEAKILSKKNVPYKPHRWHMRYISCIYFKQEISEEKEIIRVAIGPYGPKVTEAWGPIKDFKYSNRTLAKIAAIFNEKYSRRGFVINSENAELLKSFLNNDHENKIVQLSKQRKSIKLLLNRKKRQKIKNEIDLLKSMGQLKLEKNISFLLDKNGVIISTNCDSQKTQFIYPVINSNIGDSTKLKGEYSSWLSSLQGKEWLRQNSLDKLPSLEKHENDKSPESSYRIASLLWFLNINRKRRQDLSVKFISCENIIKENY